MNPLRKAIEQNPGLDFDNVVLVPKLGVVESRDKVNLHGHICGNIWSSTPLLSSPMSTITNGEFARELAKLGGIGLIHRFNTIQEQTAEYRIAVSSEHKSQVKDDSYTIDPFCAGCAIGVNEGYERLETLYSVGCRLFVVDVAHGHHKNVERFMENINGEIRHHSTFIGGSVVTNSGSRFLAEMGFSGIRVGIGNGSVCITRTKTGFGYPQLSAIANCRESIEGFKCPKGQQVRIIACGGIRNSGDIVKSLAAGANSVLIGRLFASAKEANGKGIYRGEGTQNPKYIEGIEISVENGTPLREIINDLTGGIRSGISYAGATSIKELQENAEFIRVS